MAQTKKKQSKLSKADVKVYQQILTDVGLYKGDIDGIYGPITKSADSTFRALSEKGYTKSQMFRHSIGAEHMTDDEWGDYIGGKRGFQSPKIEDTVIDTMKKGY